uniref:Protein kinase domain-containing protein n=1 Tax=Erythrolobus australicus TaxID=1077150 RepID=A0A7S1TLK3_9RHOD|mmetsp:Transcript_3962/g.10902  ORF Transcript_3962/g.10902 Transcript_3962/m.10902 type:complete len:308 (+) Transcript_3962:224-1147(+)|eukprot:CAMPEP_0185830362 /NCGR_PEP_ID=MMETSP1353-20130828/794_1 /TAXON_ID=1077150 /ORGANISM="Erythrolobus australicus, Strain CCMP3124" /LENGTH=307 /DNA_ID=CAMNT_0028528255 /DNA_START=206 /DNA_END=1129 /DNA_ORIENTATION=+
MASFGEPVVSAAIRERGYQLVSKINSGAQGTVYLARRRADGAEVALKVVSRAARSTKRELAALAALSHDGVVRLLDVFHTHDTSVLVMELLEGGDLFDWLQRSGRPGPEELYIAAAALFRSLAYVHSVGMAHRDVKIENVVMARQNEPASLRLVDFGFAVPASPGELSAHDFSGTLSYQPPEQVLKRPFCPIQGDMWSAGVLLYMLVFKRLPFGESSDARTSLRIAKQRPSLNPAKCPKISKRFLALISVLLEPVPAKRPSAALALEIVKGIQARHDLTRAVESSRAGRSRARAEDVRSASALFLKA